MYIYSKYVLLNKAEVEKKKIFKYSRVFKIMHLIRLVELDGILSKSDGV